MTFSNKIEPIVDLLALRFQNLELLLIDSMHVLPSEVERVIYCWASKLETVNSTHSINGIEMTNNCCFNISKNHNQISLAIAIVTINLLSFSIF